MKLTVQQVAEILILADSGKTNEELAKQFGVHKTTIAKLKSGKIKKGAEARELIKERIEETKRLGFHKIPEEEKLFFLIPDEYKRKYLTEKMKRVLARFNELYKFNDYWRIETEDLHKDAKELKEELLLYKDVLIKNKVLSKSTVQKYINILTMEADDYVSYIEERLYRLAKAFREDLDGANRFAINGVRGVCGTERGLIYCICEDAISAIKEFSNKVDNEKKFAGINSEKFRNKAHINVYEVLENAKRVVNMGGYLMGIITDRVEGIKDLYKRMFNTCDYFRFEKEWFSPDKVNKKYDDAIKKITSIYDELEERIKDA